MICMSMYEDVIDGVSENIEIMGIPFFAEDITPDEPYNRRDRKFTSICGGTEWVTQGKYIHREFHFSTSIFYPTGKPDAYDKIFQEMLSKPVEVISPYMGTFNAIVTIQKSNLGKYPNHMDLDVSVVEVPDMKSNIPGESFTVPGVKKVETKTKVQNKKSKTTTNNKNSRSIKSKILNSNSDTSKLNKKTIESKVKTIKKKNK